MSYLLLDNIGVILKVTDFYFYSLGTYIFNPI